MYGLTCREEPETKPLEGTTWTEDGKKFMIWVEDLSIVLGAPLAFLAFLILGVAVLA